MIIRKKLETGFLNIPFPGYSKRIDIKGTGETKFCQNEGACANDDE